MFNTQDSVPRAGEGGTRAFKYKPSPLQRVMEKLRKKPSAMPRQSIFPYMDKQFGRITGLSVGLDDLIQFGKKKWPPWIKGELDWGDKIRGRSPAVPFNPDIHVERKNVLNPKTDKRFKPRLK